MYAVDIEPTATPIVMHQAQSWKPRPMSKGPSMGTVRLLTVRLALNQSMSMWSIEVCWRADGGTRSRPRASKPERPSRKAFSRERTCLLEVDGPREASTSSCTPGLSTAFALVVASMGCPIVSVAEEEVGALQELSGWQRKLCSRRCAAYFSSLKLEGLQCEDQSMYTTTEPANVGLTLQIRAKCHI